MGIFDKAKGLIGDNADTIEDAVEDGIEMAADKAKELVPDEHDDKVELAAEKAKDLADKIDGEDG